MLDGTRLLGSRSVDTMTTAKVGAPYERRLVAESRGDKDFPTICADRPTIQRFTQRLIVLLATSPY